MNASVNHLALEAQLLVAVCLYSGGHWIGGTVALVMGLLTLWGLSR